MTAAEVPGDGALPAPQLPPRADLVVPSSERFLQLRAEAKQNGKLKDLQKLVAAWLAVGEKCNLVFEEMTRLAIYRLEVERDLGVHLAQTVHRGGDRSKSPRGTLLRDGGLPDDITKKQSRAYQRLAQITEDVFRAYLEAARTRRVLPSSRGARAFATPAKVPARSAGKNRKAKAARPGGFELPAAVVECVERIMMPDVVVGDVAMQAKQRVAPNSNDVLTRLQGDVFVAECPDPERWVESIEKSRRAARIKRAVVVLPATTWAEWFRRLEHDQWLLCFLRDVCDESGNGVMIVHIGDRPSVFRLAFRSMGVVLRAATAD